MNKKTKTQRGAEKAAAATSLFDEAQGCLDEAIGLLDEAEREHRAAAAEHTRSALAANAERAHAERVRGRIKDLLS